MYIKINYSINFILPNKLRLKIYSFIKQKIEAIEKYINKILNKEFIYPSNSLYILLVLVILVLVI